jgi:ATP-dependent Clp protease ATP-binding subunit ClpC
MNWFKSLRKKPSTPPTKEAISTERTPTFFDEAASRFASRTPDRAFDHFTPRARQVLALARKEAERLTNNFVGTEHVLLGLIRLGQGAAADLLRSQGLNLEAARVEIEKYVGAGSRQVLPGPIPFTPRTKRILAFADQEAKACKHTYVGTEHLLLALMRDGDGVAARVLNKMNIDIQQMRQAILKHFEVTPPPQSGQ